jgi:hypothetical protein
VSKKLRKRAWPEELYSVTVENGRRKLHIMQKQLAVQVDPIDSSLLARACPTRATLLNPLTPRKTSMELYEPNDVLIRGGLITLSFTVVAE